MNVYLLRVEVEINGEVKNRDGGLVLFDTVENKVEVCDKWEDLCKFYESYGLYMPFTLYNNETDKSPHITISYFNSIKQLRSDRDEMPTIKVIKTYTCTTCSFQELMKFDADDVIKYIKERM